MAKRIFVVDAKTHADRRKMVTDMREHGGNFSLDVRGGKIAGSHLETGAYSSIEMTRGLVDFHSHPSKCLDDKRCALGIPSPADISNVVLGHLYGCQAHFVYAKEGTYVIQLRPELVELLKCDFKRLAKYIKDLTKKSDQLHAHFLKSEFKYQTYIKYWLKLMTICGLTVKLFRGNKVPRVTLFYPESEKANTKYHRTIAVPKSIENTNALCQRTK